MKNFFNSLHPATPASQQNPVQIQMINDLLLIDLDDIEKETEYIVKNENGKIIRKGKFMRNKVQLNFIHLPGGHYELELNHDAEIITCSFEKHQSDYIFSGMYITHATELAGNFISKYLPD